MNVEYRKNFLKDLAKIPSKKRIHIEDFVFKELPVLDSISQNKKIEKMKGYLNFYKFRFGDYRLGLQVIGNKIICERVLHRKEIYRYFP